MTKKINLITVLGATAGGKTSFAVELAYHYNGEIIGADSRQVYKDMNLGTGKDYDDYFIHGQKIPYHLIDIVPAGYKYNVYQYQKDFLNTFFDIRNRQKLPILCGGTGMYIEAVIKGYRLIQVPINEHLRKKLENQSDEKLKQYLTNLKKVHNTTDLTNRKRLIRAIEIEEYQQNNPETDTTWPQINYILLGIKFDRDSRRRRITERLKNRLKQGMVEEVQKLIEQDVPHQTLEYYGLEYKFISLYLQNKLSYDQMVEKLNIAIHQFSKRQMTWFRKMERNGQKIYWIDGYEPQKIEQVKHIFEKNNIQIAKQN